jgi:hypothetical protein
MSPSRFNAALAAANGLAAALIALATGPAGGFLAAVALGLPASVAAAARKLP